MQGRKISYDQEALKDLQLIAIPEVFEESNSQIEREMTTKQLDGEICAVFLKKDVIWFHEPVQAQQSDLGYRGARFNQVKNEMAFLTILFTINGIQYRHAALANPEKQLIVIK